MRAVFAVGSFLGWPVEVYALFTTEAQALRHADAAACEFAVAPLPVYDSYDDCPRSLRPDAPVSEAMGRTARDEVDFVRLLLADGSETRGAPVIAVGDFETTGLPEVRALYETRAEAERHVDGRTGAEIWSTF